MSDKGSQDLACLRSCSKGSVQCADVVMLLKAFVLTSQSKEQQDNSDSMDTLLLVIKTAGLELK